MFESLGHEIEMTEGGRRTSAAKLAVFAGIAFITTLVFGGLCLLVVSLE